MTQQNPENRPDSIERIKIELIGRRNAFVALQKYDETKKQVVTATEQPNFESIQILNLDYESGILKLILNRNVPPFWTEEFNNPRGGHSYISGYRPGNFSVRGNTMSVEVPHHDENIIQDIVNHAKNYVNAANGGYVQKMQQIALEENKRRKAELERQVAEAESRKNILSNVKL
jgi:hypothetical protein